ncbi:MAG: TraR/DksA C4-type zinc finger protein [Epsilonproteobacteria bacterium]|nr:TraR/DksA C4-type zinc finger protein [Campylobacterota bacterium]
MTQEEKNTIKQTIETQITQLQKQIIELKEKTKPISPDCSLGRLTRLEAMNEKMVNEKVLQEGELKLTRLKNALLRINHEMFGICIECEESIGLGRMMIRPESVRCVACAS